MRNILNALLTRGDLVVYEGSYRETYVAVVYSEPNTLVYIVFPGTPIKEHELVLLASVDVPGGITICKRHQTGHCIYGFDATELADDEGEPPTTADLAGLAEQAVNSIHEIGLVGA